MIELRPLSKKNVTPFYKWVNDDEVIKYSLPLFLKISKKIEIDKWYEELIENKENIDYGIFLKTNRELIGYSGLCNISKTNKSAEYYIFIGNKEMWGKGIGKKVTEEVLNIGFTKHDLNRIFLTVSEPNIGGIKAYTKTGFKLEGKLRQACLRDNKFHDKIVMSMLKAEWEDKTNDKNV
ncbi:GNAT family N-acetyltransferase [Tenacibaculum sp. S7007]|uniref:GNAT family N-acetyltransferase n=1 Tax=Tenacibaculum pelagium TaxID=2759527 RepID=A0A839ASS0_9FLAO|nr:GNAT family protein [Tenacibaculum pelagium]MBA6157339.1 GNAT family N-acetyltransferase [Tenacibaculum pelagium]